MILLSDLFLRIMVVLVVAEPMIVVMRVAVVVAVAMVLATPRYPALQHLQDQQRGCADIDTGCGGSLLLLALVYIL